MGSSRTSTTRLDQILQQSREPAFWLNADLKLTWVNRAWEKLTGHSAETVAGLVCRAHGPTRAGDLQGLAGSLCPPAEALAGTPTSTRALFIHSEGERLWRLVEFWPFHADNGELRGLLGLIREPTVAPLSPSSETQRLRIELMEIRDHAQTRYGLDGIVGQGPAYRRLLDQVATAAGSTAHVLIVGESGTGKHHVARTIHQLGPRRKSPMIPFDVAALPPDVLERELFGARGGSAENVAGINFPEGSTLLIGDILELPRDLQARLAGATYSPVRLIGATSGDPEESLRAETLRPDLYFALTTLVIRLQPLRERLEELPLLAQHFLERANQRGGRQRSGFHSETLNALASYDWPGNLREFARVIDDAHGRGHSDAVMVEDLPAAIRGNLAAAYLPPPLPPSVTPLDDLLTDVERRLIENALNRARFNKSRAADLLGISRPRLYRRIKELNIPDPGDGNGVEEVSLGTDGR